MSKFNQEYEAAKAKGSPYDGLIAEAAERNGVNYDFLHKQIFLESRFNPKAKSPTGPRGLGQFTRATGKAYGLITDEDFFDPAKSIEAAARHLGDNVKASGGDYLKAALMYNQGGGSLGRPQLAGLDAGDLTKVSPEGRGYMEKLADVAGDSPFKGLFTGAPSPKPEAVSFEEATKGVTTTSKVATGEGPDLASLGIKGAAAPQLRESFAQTEFDQAEAPKGWFEGTGQAVKSELATGTLGQLFRNVTIDQVDPSEWMGSARPDTSKWTDEDFDAISAAGVDPQFYDFLFENTRGNKARLPDAIRLAKENMEHQKKIHGASTSAQIVAGFAGAATDPFTYAPVPGATATKLVSKVAQGAAYGAGGAVASEALRESSTGMEAHYGTAMVGGALIGGGLTALIDRIAQRAAPAPRLDMWDGDLERVLAMHGEAGLPNEFAGASMRLEARETARQLGGEDPTTMPWAPHETPTNMAGVDVVPHPTEPGAVRLPNGAILSGGNPINPQTIQQFSDLNERAARGVTMGGFTEIGYTLTRSANEEIRGLGNQLFRSPTGTESGSSGRFGAVASDVIERIKGQDHQSYNKIVEATTEVLKDARYANFKGGRGAAQQAAYRRVVEAIEDTTGNLKGGLSKAEQNLMDTFNAHYERKLDDLQNPAKYGNPRATSVLGATRHEGSYIPNVYDDAAKNLWSGRLGGNDELQTAIMESWLVSYASRPAVKARVDRMIQEANPGVVMTPRAIQNAVEEYARSKAYGISHTQDFSRSHLVDDQLTGLVGAENNNFLEGRHLFDSDMQVHVGNGEMFAVNDLRAFDMDRITASYDRRVNGDVGIMAATGESTDALKDRIVALGVGKESKKEVEALQDAVKLLTGRARRDPDGVLATVARSLTDMSFVAKNAYMGIQGITETAALITKGHGALLMKGVPFFKQMSTMGSKATPEFLNDMHGLVFGRELDNIIRPSREDIVMRLRDHADASPLAANVVGSVKWATGELSARSPFTKFLQESSNYIADAGRQGVLKELVDFAHGTPSRMGKKLFDAERLKSMSLTPEQFKGMQDLIKEATVVRNGKVEIVKPELFQNDPRSMDIWRLGDKIADETILRPHKLSSQDTEAYGAGVKLAMQFKNFTMRSMNSRLVRGYYDSTKNGRALDQTMQAILSTGMAGAMYMAMKYSQAVSMPGDQQEDFLKQALDPNMVAYAAISRGSHIGAPFGLANLVAAPLGFDQAAMVRTSITPRPKEQRDTSGPMKYKPTTDDRVTGFLGRLADQVPAAGWALSGVQVGVNAFGSLDSTGRAQDTEYMTGMYNGLRGVLPNDPATQFLLLKIMEEQGIEIR